MRNTPFIERATGSRQDGNGLKKVVCHERHHHVEVELAKYWDEMKAVANDENVSLLGVSGAVTMGTLNRVKTVGQGTLTGVQVVGGLVSRPFVDHYSQSLATIRQDGLFVTLKDTSAPYVEAVWNNFSGGQGTWTEELLSGRVAVC